MPLSDSQLCYLAWSNLSQSGWTLFLTSSIAYSCFTKNMPKTAPKGPQLLFIAVWHSKFFIKQTPSRVREMRKRSYCCPKLVRKGVRTLHDFVTRISHRFCRRP